MYITKYVYKKFENHWFKFHNICLVVLIDLQFSRLHMLQTNQVYVCLTMYACTCACTFSIPVDSGVAVCQCICSQAMGLCWSPSPHSSCLHLLFYLPLQKQGRRRRRNYTWFAQIHDREKHILAFLWSTLWVAQLPLKHSWKHTRAQAVIPATLRQHEIKLSFFVWQ